MADFILIIFIPKNFPPKFTVVLLIKREEILEGFEYPKIHIHPMISTLLIYFVSFYFIKGEKTEKIENLYFQTLRIVQRVQVASHFV